MNPWLETAGVIFVAALGGFVGWIFSRSRRPIWTAAYFVPLVLIGMVVIAKGNNALSFVAPFSWISLGRTRFVILALAATMGLTAPLSRLPRKGEKVLSCVLMVAVLTWFAVLPFLLPALIHDELSSLPTQLDSDGICFQSKDYTCAPAAAVTALGRLGLHGEEGQIAVLSHTTPITGTLPGCLSSALQNRYGSDGLKCQYRRFDSIDQLKEAGITLAMVRDAPLSDHCVAVLEVSDHIVTFADPVWGKTKMSHAQFEKIWRFTGIVLTRDHVQQI